MKKKSTYNKAIDETYKIPDKRGNGILKFSVDIDEKGSLSRYSLAYINPKIFSKDNGRVLGYDNDHGYHHRHYMGTVKKIEFKNFEDVEKQFGKEWRELHEKYQKEK